MADPNDELTMSPASLPSPPAPSPRARSHEPQDAVPTRAAGRRMPARLATALEHARTCARLAADNRARDVLLLDLREVTPLVDFFVIATATSRRQAGAVASEIDAEMKKLGEWKLGLEGSEEGRWTLIDYGDFVVHVFSEEARAYYALEEIWGDAPRLEWQDPARVHPAAHPADDEEPGRPMADDQ
jgi:ribosome-associated protein